MDLISRENIHSEKRMEPLTVELEPNQRDSNRVLSY